MKVYLFISTVLVILFAFHYVFFKSIVHFFGVTAPWLKTVLYTAMVLLTFAFSTAFSLLQWEETPWTVGYYLFAGTWMGFLIHFLAAILLIWGVTGICRLTGAAPKLPVLAALVLAMTAFACLYGIYNAFSPRVREMTVRFQNLPAYWQDRTIVQLSDVHLGYIQGLGFAQKLVSRVNALQPDLIVITGDLFDGMGGPFEAFIDPLNRLRATHGVLFVTGNHEHYTGIDRALAIIEKTQLQVIDNRWINIEGLEIIGVSYPGIENLTDIADLPPQDSRSTPGPRILLFHTPTNLRHDTADHMQQHFSTYWMPDTGFALNRKLAVDLQLSGHTHHGQIFPGNLLTKLLYRGHDYGLSGNGNFLLYTTCGVGTWGTPMRTVGHSEIVRFKLKRAAYEPSASVTNEKKQP